MYFRTVSNCKPAPKPPKLAAVGGPAPDDVEMAGGDAVAENEGGGIVAKAVIFEEAGQPVHELERKAQKVLGRDEVTAKVLNILEKDAEDDDKVSLVLASIGKRIKKNTQRWPSRCCH